MRRSSRMFAVWMVALLGAGTSSAWEVDDWRIHGFISQGYMQSSDNNYLANTEDGTFAFTEAGINLTAVLSDRMHAGMQLFSRRLGSRDDYDLTIDWAYGDYRLRDEFGIRVGKIRTPMGLYNQAWDLDFARTPVLLPQSNYPEFLRDIIFTTAGGGVYGHWVTETLGTIHYEAVGGTVKIDPDSAFVRSLADVPGETILDLDISTKYAAAASGQWQPPIEGLRLGASRMVLSGRADVTTTESFESLRNRIDMNVFSLEYLWKDWTFAAEYTVLNISTGEPTSPDPRPSMYYKPEGYYALVAYRWTPWLETGVYYSEYFHNRDDRNGRILRMLDIPDYMAWQKDWAFTVRFDINDHWLIKLEAHDMNGGAFVFPADNPDGVKQNWQLYLVKSTFMF